MQNNSRRELIERADASLLRLTLGSTVGGSGPTFVDTLIVEGVGAV